MNTGIVVAILFVIGLGLGIVKVLQKRRRKMQIYSDNGYCDSGDPTSATWQLRREVRRKYTRSQEGLGLAMFIGVVLGAAATVFTAYSANRAGIVQISLMREVHTRNVRPAAPKIGTSLRIQEEQAAFPPF